MDIVDIAKSMAEIFNGLEHSGDSRSHNNRHVSHRSWQHSACNLRQLEYMTAKLAESRVNETNRDFWDVLSETQFEVTVEMAKILAETIDPVLQSLRKVVIKEEEEEEEEEEGHVCGVCQDEMEVGDQVRAMGCMHNFHAYCIVKWLQESNACPLCKYPTN